MLKKVGMDSGDMQMQAPGTANAQPGSPGDGRASALVCSSAVPSDQSSICLVSSSLCDPGQKRGYQASCSSHPSPGLAGTHFTAQCGKHSTLSETREAGRIVLTLSWKQPDQSDCDTSLQPYHAS